MVMLSPLKKVLKGHRFGLNKYVKAAAVQWFQQQPREFLEDGIHQLVFQWSACRNTHGDYF
jgi:hypothetical protein